MIGLAVLHQDCQSYSVEDGTGRVKVIRVPLPGWLSAQIRPPWASTMPRLMLRPRPDPPPTPERDLSAREILDRRFARGEISREEYNLIRETISSEIA